MECIGEERIYSKLDESEKQKKNQGKKTSNENKMNKTRTHTQRRI